MATPGATKSSASVPATANRDENAQADASPLFPAGESIFPWSVRLRDGQSLPRVRFACGRSDRLTFKGRLARGEPGLATRASKTRPNNTRSRVAAMLLVLVAYASVANATHSHGPAARPASASSVCSTEDKGSSGTPASDHKSNCPTCRLQRSFNSALRSPSISFELIQQIVPCQTCRREHRSVVAFVVFSGRAPPLL
jgi:hypothetical protein